VSVRLTVTTEPSADDVAAIGRELTAFNDADVGDANRVPLAVLMHDDAGKLVGGLSAWMAWGWIYIQWLWLDDAHRGQGLAGQLLEAAEAEAIRHGCHGAHIDTFSPIALKTYQRAGYVPFGAIEDFPIGSGRTRTYLQKRL